MPLCMKSTYAVLKHEEQIWDCLSWPEYGGDNTKVVVWSPYQPFTLELDVMILVGSFQNVCDYLWYDLLRQTCTVFKKKLFCFFPCSVKQRNTTQAVAEIVVSCSLASSFPRVAQSRQEPHLQGTKWPLGCWAAQKSLLPKLTATYREQTSIWSGSHLEMKMEGWNDVGSLWKLSESRHAKSESSLYSSSRLQSPCSRCKPICWLQVPIQLHLPCRAVAFLHFFFSKIFPPNPTCSMTLIISEEPGSNKEVETLISCSAPPPQPPNTCKKT